MATLCILLSFLSPHFSSKDRSSKLLYLLLWNTYLSLPPVRKFVSQHVKTILPLVRGLLIKSHQDPDGFPRKLGKWNVLIIYLIVPTWQYWCTQQAREFWPAAPSMVTLRILLPLTTCLRINSFLLSYHVIQCCYETFPAIPNKSGPPGLLYPCQLGKLVAQVFVLSLQFLIFCTQYPRNKNLLFIFHFCRWLNELQGHLTWRYWWASKIGGWTGKLGS